MSQSTNEALRKEVLTLFMRTESVVRGTRITRDGAIVQPVDDIAAGIESCMRSFKHEGDAVQASTQLTMLLNMLTTRFKSWEQENQRLEKNKVEMNNSPSGARLKRIAVEATAVKASVQTTLSKMRALITALSQTASLEPNSGASDAAVNGMALGAGIDIEQLSGWEKLVYELLDGSFEVHGKNGSKVGFGSRIREQIVDPNLKALLTVQWAPTEHEKLRLCFWIFPKTTEVRKHMKENPWFSLELSSEKWEASQHIDLQWEKSPSLYPQTEDIKKYLEILRLDRFPTKAKIGCLFGCIELDESFSDGVLQEVYKLGFI